LCCGVTAAAVAARWVEDYFSGRSVGAKGQDCYLLTA
jgi:hypothetical protein